jgi:hypothetical protein
MMGFRFSARRRAKDAQQPTFAHQRRESFLRGTGATLEALIAAFCRLDKLLSGCWEKGWLVGAVGIEFMKAQNPKELRGMCCSRKSFVVLSRNCNCPRIAPAFW